MMFAKKALGTLTYLHSQYSYDVDVNQLNKKKSKFDYFVTKEGLSRKIKQRSKKFEQYMLRKAQECEKDKLTSTDVNLDDQIIDSYENIEPALKRYLTADEFETLVEGWYEQLVMESAQ
jgi:hypothetical protein